MSYIDQVINKIKEAEEDVKRGKVDPDLRKIFLSYAQNIYDISKNYEMVYSFFESNKERSILGQDFLDKEKCLDYITDLSTPSLEKVNATILQKDYENLENIKQRSAMENECIKNIVGETVAVFQAKINILIGLKNGDGKMAFKFAKEAYGDVDEKLYQEAFEYYKKRIEYLGKKKFSKTMQSGNEKLDADGIKYYFDMTLKKTGLKNYGFETVIDKNVSFLDVRFSPSGFSHPVIFIPQNRIASKRKVFQLIAHEIGSHAVANFGNQKLGIKGLSLGRDWEVVHEGMALLNEDLVKEVIRDKPLEFDFRWGAYYILAMYKIKKALEANEKDIPEKAYSYIFDMSKNEMLAKGKTPKESERLASRNARKVLSRLYRGLFPYYLPKDKAYFEGKVIASRMKQEGVDCYSLISKVDPVLIPDLIRIGFYKDSGPLQAEARNMEKIAQQMWFCKI